MSKALERVQNALKADEQRLLKKEKAKVFGGKTDEFWSVGCVWLC